MHWRILLEKKVKLLNKWSREDKEHRDKLIETLLYSIGSDNAEVVCEENDLLLEKYKDIEVPESLNQWFEQYSEKLELRRKRKEFVKRFGRIAKKAAVIFMAIIIGLGVVTMSVDALRIRFLNMIIEVNERFSSVEFEERESVENKEDLPKDWKDYYPTVIPDGYTLKTWSTTSKSARLVYSNELGEELVFIQGPLTGEVHLDTEDAVVFEIEINGFEALMIEEDGRIMIYWRNGSYAFSLKGYLDKEIMIKIVKSVEKNN